MRNTGMTGGRVLGHGITGILGIFAATFALSVTPQARGGTINYFTQEHYRWRNDDGNESAATWKVASDTPSNANVGENVRLRICLWGKTYSNDSAKTPIDPPLGHTMCYAENLNAPPDQWKPVPVSGDLEPFVMSETQWYQQNDAAAYLLAGSRPASVYPGKCVEAPWNAPGTVTNNVTKFSFDSCVNVEYCLRPTAKASGKTYYFRAAGSTAESSGGMIETHPMWLQTAQLTVNAAAIPPVIVSALTATAQEGAAFTYTILATGVEPMVYSVSGLPGGLSFSGAKISGSPTVSGTYNVVLRATNAAGSDSRTLVLTVTPAETTIIVDNANGVAMDGSWSMSVGLDPWSSNSVFGSQSTSDEGSFSRFRWLPKVQRDGNYSVYAWWTHHPRRASIVPYRINHADGLSRVDVNQSDPALAGKWNLLGTYRFTVAGSTGTYVEVSAEYGPTVCADAIKLVMSSGPLNVAPGAGLAVNTSMGTAPLTVIFDAGASADSDGDALTYAWDFGDGASGAGKNPSHQYSQPGRYAVRLTVSDGKGAGSTASATVRVVK